LTELEQRAVVRPNHGRIVHDVARIRELQEQLKADRCLGEALLDLIEQIAKAISVSSLGSGIGLLAVSALQFGVVAFDCGPGKTHRHLIGVL
jgi:hypothetical protein